MVLSRNAKNIYNILYIFGLKKSRAEGARNFLRNIYNNLYIFSKNIYKNILSENAQESEK